MITTWNLSLFFFFAINQAIGADGSPAQLNEEVVAKLIDRQEELARGVCERIKGDSVWKKVADGINERLKLVNDLSEKDDLPSSIYVEMELRKVVHIYNKIRYERLEKAKQHFSALVATREARVLRSCGEELFREGLLPPAEKISADQLRDKIADLSSKLKEHDDNWMDIIRCKNPARYLQFCL